MRNSQRFDSLIWNENKKTQEIQKHWIQIECLNAQIWNIDFNFKISKYKRWLNANSEKFR